MAWDYSVQFYVCDGLCRTRTSHAVAYTSALLDGRSIMSMRHPSDFSEEDREDFNTFIKSIRDTVGNPRATKKHKLHCVQMLAFLVTILGPPPTPNGPGDGERDPLLVAANEDIPVEYRKTA